MEHEYTWYDVAMKLTVVLRVPGDTPAEAKQLAVRVIQGVGFFGLKARRLKAREAKVERHPDWLIPEKLSF